MSASLAADACGLSSVVVDERLKAARGRSMSPLDLSLREVGGISANRLSGEIGAYHKCGECVSAEPSQRRQVLTLDRMGEQRGRIFAFDCGK